MKNNKDKIKVYFRSKHHPKEIFSSEIFDKCQGGVSICEATGIPDNNLTYKRYYNINDILNDGENFIICTDDSFTKSELMMIEDVVYASGRQVYSDEQVMAMIHKIENMIMNGVYLPNDKNEIIKK